jgi:hypothetical protein
MPAVNTQPQFPVYPFMIQSPVAPNMSYVLERVPPAGQIGAIGPMPPSYPMMRPVYQTPPSPALTVRNDFSPSRPSSGYPRFDSRRQNAARVTRSPYHNSASHHNHVDIGRIRDGIDVRTTVCYPLPPRRHTNLGRSCFVTFPTRLIRRCSSASLMSQAGASTTSCTCALILPTTASENYPFHEASVESNA